MKLLIADPFGLGTALCVMEDTEANHNLVESWFQMNRRALEGEMNEDYRPLDAFLRKHGVQLFETHLIRPGQPSPRST